MTFPPPARPFLLIASIAMLNPAAAAAQQAAGSPANKTEAAQITPRTASGTSDRGVFLDEPRPAQPRSGPVQVDALQIPRPQRAATATAQISAPATGPERVLQLSKSELDATLAQLTPAERSILLQAVAGTDICDRPPAVAAIVTLCKNRIETRAGDLGKPGERPVSAEERLLRGGLESNGMPAVEAVIARLARVSDASSTEEFSSQAIASVALTQPTASPPPGTDDGKSGLSDGTNALINALVQQLGGPPGAVPPPNGGR